MKDIQRLSRESSVSVRIAQQIVELIAAGTFGVGVKLPSEMELARQFGVSRPSVREALGALQFAGYVESVRGSGTHVISTGGSAGLGGPAASSLPMTAALDVFEARLLVEPHVAALAAKDPVAGKIDDAAELVEGMHLVVHEPGLHAATDLRIHRAIADICPNEVMRSHAIQLLDLAASPTLEKVRNEAWKGELLPTIWGDQHQEVLHAIAGHDPQAAAEATWVHLVSAVLSALEVLAADPAIDEQTVRRVQSLADQGPVLPHAMMARPARPAPPRRNGYRMTTTDAPAALDFDLTCPEPIPQAGINRALELMQSGRLFRYVEAGEGEMNDAAMLEQKMADLVGRTFAVGVNSCGASLFLALRCCGVQPGDHVLVNGYTLAPVPGAIDHAGAVPIVVEITEQLTIDLQDLRVKAAGSGARVLLLSHMRGHIADLVQVRELCDELGLVLVEDCAHTLGASWAGRPTGTFGAVGCFSLQTFKHLNSGEGGVLVTDDPEIAARAILHSGSYMLYAQHTARPDESVFEPLRGRCADYSLRMTALAAAMVLPQLEALPERIARMNGSYARLEQACRDIPQVRVIERATAENFVGSSFQFGLPGLSAAQITSVVATADELGLNLKWYGEPTMRGFTSRPAQWDYVPSAADVPRTEAVLRTLCDLGIPPGLSADHGDRLAEILRYAVNVATRTGTPETTDTILPHDRKA